MEDMKRLEAREADLSARLAALHERLQDQSTGLEAMEVLRQLVDQVTLVPENGALAIVLKGDLAERLSFAAGKKTPGFYLKAGLSGVSESPGSLVAGRGFEPLTFRL